MAEFCLECSKRFNANEPYEVEYETSDDIDLCEGCEEWKPVVIMKRWVRHIHKKKFFNKNIWYK